MNPATARRAMEQARDDPETNAAAMGLGGLLMLGVMVWTAILQFRCFSYAHQLFDWQLVWAILLSLVISAPVVKVMQWVSQLFIAPAVPGGPEAEPEGEEKVRFRLPALLAAAGVFLAVAGACTLFHAHARQETVVIENLGRLDGQYKPQQQYLAGAVLASLGAGLATYAVAARVLHHPNPGTAPTSPPGKGPTR